jgi:hypothetical protein
MQKSVFINRPFDSEFRDLLLAIVFSVASHGFVPRSALESEGIAEPRSSRILKTLSECKYSIHDLSRYSGEGVDNISRFNMPLELGMAAAFRFERLGSDRPHNWQILVPEGFVYQRFISDLAGFDPGKHAQSVDSVIREVSTWLRLQDDVVASPPSAFDIFNSFTMLRQSYDELQAASLQRGSWADLLLACYKAAPRS